MSFRGSTSRRERGVARGWVVVAIGLLLGAALGWAVSAAGNSADDPAGTASPFEAADPSLPGTTRPPVLPDPDIPPLGEDLTYVNKRIGAFRYDVPRGWVRVDESNGDRWTLPKNPAYSFSMRVSPLPVPVTTAEMASDRARLVRRDEENVIVEAITDDSLRFTYILDDHLRYQHSLWLPRADSDLTAFEISISGREVDRPGIDALVQHVAESVRPVGR